MMKIKLPPDVKSLWWSGQYWYACSKETVGRGRLAHNPKFHGFGSTRHQAVWDMRKSKHTVK